MQTITRINMPIPDDVHHALKVAAAEDATTLRETVIEALTEYVSRRYGPEAERRLRRRRR